MLADGVRALLSSGDELTTVDRGQSRAGDPSIDPAAATTVIAAAIRDSERRWQQEVEPVSHSMAAARYQSPLRYAGAKSALAPVIARIISAAKKSSEVRDVKLLVEPFAGGASASLRLVGAGVVDRVLLADADPLVACFWQAAADDTDRLQEKSGRNGLDT